MQMHSKRHDTRRGSEPSLVPALPLLEGTGSPGLHGATCGTDGHQTKLLRRLRSASCGDVLAKPYGVVAGWAGTVHVQPRLPGLFFFGANDMDTMLVTDTDVTVTKDGELHHVMLRIGDKDYDISEMVYDDMAVQAAIETLESMSTRAI